MEVQTSHLVIFVFLQIILEIGSGCTLPLNTGLPQTDPCNILSENLPFLDDNLQNINVCNPIESCRILPSFLSINVPNIDNSFKSVLSYGEECAMKYRQFRKLPCLEGLQMIVPPNPCLLPTIVPSTAEFGFPVNELTIPPPILSGLRPPLQVTSAVTGLEQICNNDLTNSNPCFSTPSSCDSLYQEIISSSPLSSPVTYSTSNLDLLRSFELLESIFSPILAEQLLRLPVSDFVPGPLSAPAITTTIEPNINNVTPLVSPRPTFSLPLAVTSTTYDMKPPPSLDYCLPSTTISSFANIPAMPINNDELFIPTPNILPNPLVPLSINYNGINTDAPLSIDFTNSAFLYNANQFICPPLIDSELPFYNCPIVPTSAQKLPVLVSCRGFYQGSTLPSLGTKLTSPLYRNCHTLKPLSECTSTLPSCPLSNSLPVSDFNCYTLPPVLPTGFPSIIDNSLAHNYKINQLLDDCTSSSNSLSFSTLPCELSLSGSPVSNCLSPTPLLQSDSLLLYDDFPYSLCESCCNSFKRSPNINEAPELSYKPNSDTVLTEINKTSAIAPSMNVTKASDSNNYTKKLRELIALVELMLVDDNVDERTMNDVLSMLPN